MKKNIRTIASAIVTAAVLLSPEGSLPVMASDAGDLVQRVEFDDTASDPVNTTNYEADDSAESSGTSLYEGSSDGSSYRTLTNGNVTVSGMFPEDVTMTAEDDKDLYSWIAGDGQRVLFAYDVTFKHDGLFYIPDDSDLEYTIAADGYVPSEQKNAHVYHVNGDTKTEVTDASYMDDTAFTTAESGVFVCVADKPAGKAVQVKRTAAVTGPRKAASGTDIDSGTLGDNGSVSWKITSDGTLDIYPTDGKSGTFGTKDFNYSGRYSDGSGKFLVSSSPWSNHAESIIRVDVTGKINFPSGQVSLASAMFADLANCTSMDLSGLDTSNVVYMPYMFYGCESLKSLDLSGFDTSNVISMSEMFGWCSSLQTLDLKNFNTSKVEYMEAMFWGCEALTSLNVSTFNTSKVISMARMFANCKSLAALNVLNFDTGNVNNMSNMFNYCSTLPSLNVSKFNTSNVTDMSGMFKLCESLKTLTLSNFNTKNVINMSEMFANCKSLAALNVSNFDTSNVGTMSTMFFDCNSLATLNIKNFNTSKVEYFDYMFKGCESLKELDISSFDTGNAIIMSGMFSECRKLIELNVTGLNTSKVTAMDYMFNQCQALEVIDVSNFDTSNVNNMSNMFNYCSELKTILSKKDFNTSKLRVNSSSMYELSTNLMGGNGTKNDEVTYRYRGNDYAKVDRPGTPGYFTDKIYIHLDANGGNDLNPGYVAIEYEGTLGTLPAPTRDGYTFAGWYTSKDGGTKADSNSKVTESATYYAHWTRNTYTVTVPASVELTRIHDAVCGADNYQTEIPIQVTGTVPSSGVTVTTEDGTIHRNDNDKITTALKVSDATKQLIWKSASNTAKNAMASAHITRAGEYSGSVTISFDSN